MKDRNKLLNRILLIAYIIIVFIPAFGEEGAYPLIYTIVHGTSKFFQDCIIYVKVFLDCILMLIVFVLILVHFILLKIKNDNLLLHKMLVIGQVVLLITILIVIFFMPVYMLFIMILLTISLLQVINLFITSSKGYKVGSFITICVSLLCFITFWYINATVCRFEFELNDDGTSYAIVEIKSDIHTITIPTTYEGLPVTRIVRVGLPSKKNIEEVFIPIEVIYVDKYAISYCPNAIIYCEAESRPETWDENWCYEAEEIIWGYKEK